MRGDEYAQAMDRGAVPLDGAFGGRDVYKRQDLAVKLVGFRVAHHAAYVGGNAVERFAVSGHLHLDALPVHCLLYTSFLVH